MTSVSSALPINADLLLDTSAAVALCLASADGHDAVIDRSAGAVLGLAGHTAPETYSVLTRLPGSQRLSAAVALKVIAQNFPASHHLSADRASTALSELADAGVSGGAVYDGLVALAAREAGIVLLSRDRRASPVYGRIGTRFELI